MSDVTAELREEFHALFAAGFDGVSRAKFMKDLAAKSHVMVLRDDAGTLCGFSTVTVHKRRYDGRDVRLVFNGDTVIDPDHWGSTALFREWFRFLLNRYAEFAPVPTLWLLTTKGHRTFRVLPLFFRRFWPSWSERSRDPSLASLADQIGASEFPGRYDPQSGVVALAPNGERLSDDLAEIPEKDAQREDVQFFLRRNRNYRSGEELLCLARIEPNNLTTYARRYLNIT